MKILIVEDSIDIVNVYTEVLRDAAEDNQVEGMNQVEIDIAYDAKTYFNKFKDNTYDLVILDWMLDVNQTSKSVIKNMNGHARYSVMITGYPGKQDMRKVCTEQGVNEVLSKTLGLTQLLEVVRRAINVKNSVVRG